MIAAMLTSAAESEEHREIPLPAEVYGLLVLAALVTLLLVTFAFRSVRTRH
jgi:hypothetical protein